MRTYRLQAMYHELTSLTIYRDKQQSAKAPFASVSWSGLICNGRRKVEKRRYGNTVIAPANMRLSCKVCVIRAPSHCVSGHLMA
jgi:hypothetical protein